MNGLIQWFRLIIKLYILTYFYILLDLLVENYIEL